MNNYLDYKTSFYHNFPHFYNEYDEIEMKIMSFSLLTAGWNYGEGELINMPTISKAIELYKFGKINGFKVDAFPMVDGGINLSIYMNEYALDITVNKVLKINIEIQKGIGQSYEVVNEIENAEYPDIFLLLNEIRTACLSLGSYQFRDITIPALKDFRVPHSSTPQETVAVFPFLNSIVQETLPETYASI